MSREVHDYVAENTRRTRQIDTRFVEVSSERTRNLSFSNNTLAVTVAIEVYTRDLQDGLISGHPNAKHGSGRGVAGDTRGAWTLQSSAAASKDFTRGGRQAVLESLDGQASGGIRFGTVGTDSTAASASDSALGSEFASVSSYGVADTADTVRSRADHRFSEHPGASTGSAEEYGVEANDGTLMARVTESVSLTVEDELRVDISLTTEGSGIGNQVVPDTAATAVRDALRSPAESIGIDEIAFGTGTSTFTTSDTGLTLEEYRKSVLRTLTTENIEALIHTTRDEPAGQPVDLGEIGVFDNNGNALMLATFDPFEKTDEFPFNARVSFRVV